MSELISDFKKKIDAIIRQGEDGKKKHQLSNILKHSIHDISCIPTTITPFWAKVPTQSGLVFY